MVGKENRADNAYPFHDVDYENDAVDQPNGTSNFVHKVDMSRGVDEMNQVRLPAAILQHQRHRTRFDGDLSLTGKHMRVRVTCLQRV